MFFLFFVILCQAQLISSMQLTTNQITPPGPLTLSSPLASEASQPSGGGGDGVYGQNFVPLFPGKAVPSDQVVSSSQLLSHDPLSTCVSGQNMASAAPMVQSSLDSSSTQDITVAPSVITHTASSTVTCSDAATTFSQGTDYSSISTLPPPPPCHLQPLASMPASSVQHHQTFALPRPVQSTSANKNRPVQRIAVANTLPSSHLILTGLWVLN